MRGVVGLLGVVLVAAACSGEAIDATTSVTADPVTEPTAASTTTTTTTSTQAEPEVLWIEIRDLTSKVDMGGEASFLVASGGGSGQVSVDVSQVFTRGPLASSAPTDSYLTNFVVEFTIDAVPEGDLVSASAPMMPGHYGFWVTATDDAGDRVEEYVEVSVNPTVEGVLNPPHPLVGMWFKFHPQPDEWRAIEDSIGHDMTIVSVEFTSFCTRGCNEADHLHRFYDWIVEANRVPLVSFDYFNYDWDTTLPAEEQPTLDDILAGEWDEYLANFAAVLGSFDGPILMAPGWEPNITSEDDTWRGPRAFGPNADQHWSAVDDLTTHFGDRALVDGPERYVEVWRHVWGIFKAQGADNVMFVWRPNWISDPSPTVQPWHNIDSYWPGDEYVDLIGPSVFNYADLNRDFDSLWREELAELVSLHPDTPVLAGEMGSDARGNDPLWYADTLVRLEAHGYVAGAVFFSEHMEGQYAFHDDLEKTKAVAEVLDQGYYGYSE